MTDFAPAYAPCSACSALVLLEGKLRKRQQGEQWELIVSGYELTPVLAPVSAGSNSEV